MRRICSVCGIDCLVERSRSGKGAHVWIFFDEAVSAVKARMFDWQNYMDIFSGDVASAKTEVVISSPGLGSRKVWKSIKEVAPLQERGVHIAVLTLAPSAYSDDAAGHQEELVGALRSVGISVQCSERCREHFAVIDNTVVWYGSMNLLSREKEEDSMMRLENASIAQELLLKWVDDCHTTISPAVFR